MHLGVPCKHPTCNSNQFTGPYWEKMFFSRCGDRTRELLHLSRKEFCDPEEAGTYMWTGVLRFGIHFAVCCAVESLHREALQEHEQLLGHQTAGEHELPSLPQPYTTADSDGLCCVAHCFTVTTIVVCHHSGARLLAWCHCLGSPLPRCKSSLGEVEGNMRARRS
eukprot:EC690278.1.p1 GENE.EC690278.1~~EC690278.1.p1  ORF type:complete len:165 (+),score=12.27 EC690278.1:116-610(+)